MLSRAPRTKETLPDLFENMDPNKWDTTMWYWVTRNLQEFCGFTDDSCHSRVIRNQQNLHPRVPTAVAKLLQYNGFRVEHMDGFSSYK